MAHEKFDVGGMTCAACQAHVDKAVCSLAGVKDVSVNLLSGSMTVDFDENQVSPDDICTAVDRAGYSATPVDTGTVAQAGATAGPGAAHHESPTKKLEAAAASMKTRLIVSIVFLIPLFYIGMGHMLGRPLPAARKRPAASGLPMVADRPILLGLHSASLQSRSIRQNVCMPRSARSRE